MSNYLNCQNYIGLFIGLALTACASKVQTPFSTPKQFSIVKYCENSGSVEPLNIPNDVIAVLEDKNIAATEEQLVEALLTRAALEIAHGAHSQEECLSTFEVGQKKFSNMLKFEQKSIADRGGFKPSKQAEVLDVQTEITGHWRDDQSGRRTYLALRTDDKVGADYWAHKLSVAHSKRVDAASKVYLENLLERYDWIDNKRFGRDVSAHAWIIVQHADDHPKFQARALERMEPYLKTKGIKPANYAYLWDRVAVNTGQKTTLWHPTHLGMHGRQT